MAKPIVTEYLEIHTLEQLRADHGINFRVSSDLRKVSLNYDMIESKSGVKLVEECRGLVLRPDVPFANEKEVHWRMFGPSTVACWPLNRFYNADDPHAAPVDWNDPKLRVYEKLDGTMIAMYFDHVQGNWCAATRSVPEADLAIRKGDMLIGDMTYAELFFKTFTEQGGFFVNMDRTYTYVFELTGPANRVVVEYEDTKVTLLAVRKLTGEEVDISGSAFAVNRWRANWKNAQSLRAAVSMIPPSECEGAVVVDSAFRRVKVKSEAYVAAHRKKDSVTTSKRNALSAVFLGVIDDILPTLDPASRQKYEALRDNAAAWVRQVDSNFSTWKAKSNGDRKAFALEVMASGDYPGIYFELLKGNHASASDLVQSWANQEKFSDSALDQILGRISTVEQAEKLAAVA